MEIVRHYMALAQLNYSVDDGFYPLGSCTMKYNPKINEKLAAADELQAHPYAPHDLVQGNLEIMARLEEWLVELTGLAGFTLTPAAGAHGEFTGMLIIRKYLQEKGDAAQGRADPRFGPRHQPGFGPFRRLRDQGDSLQRPGHHRPR